MDADVQLDDVWVSQETQVLDLDKGGHELPHPRQAPPGRSSSLTSRCTRLDISAVEILRLEMNFIATLSPVMVCRATETGEHVRMGSSLRFLPRAALTLDLPKRAMSQRGDDLVVPGE